MASNSCKLETMLFQWRVGLLNYRRVEWLCTGYQSRSEKLPVQFISHKKCNEHSSDAAKKYVSFLKIKNKKMGKRIKNLNVQKFIHLQVHSKFQLLNSDGSETQQRILRNFGSQNTKNGFTASRIYNAKSFPFVDRFIIQAYLV